MKPMITLDELNESFIENFDDTYIDEDSPTQPDSLLASPSTSSNTVKKITKKQSLLTSYFK